MFIFHLTLSLSVIGSTDLFWCCSLTVIHGRGWWWTVRSWLLAREGSGLGWSRFSGGRWVGISDWSVRWWSGVTQSARVNSPCFCAQAVGPGSLMSCIYKRMTDRRLPYLVSRPFLFSTKSDKHTVINNASPLSLSCALLECCWWRYPDERAYIFDRTINYVVKSSPEKGAVLLFCCSAVLIKSGMFRKLFENINWMSEMWFTFFSVHCKFPLC